MPQPTDGQERITAADRYGALMTHRDPTLRRAQESSRLTIPSLIPPDGTGDADRLYKPFQSLGARGVNHLAAKMMLALFPPNMPFFRLGLTAKAKSEVEAMALELGDEDRDLMGEFEFALSGVEQTMATELEQANYRTGAVEALLHLFVAGNVLVFVEDNGALTVYPISRYCVKRDGNGTVLDILVKEEVARRTLPEEALTLLPDDPEEEDGTGKDKAVDLYTWVRRVDNAWRVHQEVEGKIIPGTEGRYREHESPWLPLRFAKVDGADYARGFVEQYIGDLMSLESLTESIVMFAAVAAKILVFVDDTGLTQKKDVARARSGDVVDGRAEDVTFAQLEKFADFQVANAVAGDIRQRLEQVFMLMSGVQRNAERVTAEEIRALVNELEQGLGGIYAILSQEFLAPYVRRAMRQMEGLPDLPVGSVSPEVITGIDALGRTSDLGKLDALLAGLQSVAPPEVIVDYVNIGAYARRRAAALGVDSDGLIRTEQQVAAMRAQRQEQALAERAAGPAAAAQAQQA